MHCAIHIYELDNEIRLLLILLSWYNFLTFISFAFLHLRWKVNFIYLLLFKYWFGLL